MEKYKKKKFFRKVIIRIFLGLFLLLLGSILIELYIFKGFYSAGYIAERSDDISRDSTCQLTIKELPNHQYLITFKNSITPKFFLNYRDDQLLQTVTDSLFFMHIRGNLIPSRKLDYSNAFDCGTGLGLTSINPYESHEIIKSYDDIIEESVSNYLFHNTKYIRYKYKNKHYHPSRNGNALFNDIAPTFLINDSIQLEYHMTMYSFLSKTQTYTVSNKINLSVVDLFNQYQKKWKKTEQTKK